MVHGHPFLKQRSNLHRMRSARVAVAMSLAVTGSESSWAMLKTVGSGGFPSAS